MSEDVQIPRREFLKKAAALGGTALALSHLGLAAQAVEKAKHSSTAPTGKAKGLTTDGNPVPYDHPMRPYDAQHPINAKDFPNLSLVEGITQNQIHQHLGLYMANVKRINAIHREIASLPPNALEEAGHAYNSYRALHLEQSYELNGVVLHEYYFENLGGGKTSPAQTELVYKIFTQEFGSWDNYTHHLLSVGKAMRGWAMTAYNMRDQRVHNYGLDLHNQAVPVNVIPLLVLDVYEHSYLIDFGTNRPAYLEVFLRNVNWDVVDRRLKTMILHG